MKNPVELKMEQIVNDARESIVQNGYYSKNTCDHFNWDRDLHFAMLRLRDAPPDGFSIQMGVRHGVCEWTWLPTQSFKSEFPITQQSMMVEHFEGFVKWVEEELLNGDDPDMRVELAKECIASYKAAESKKHAIIVAWDRDAVQYAEKHGYLALLNGDNQNPKGDLVEFDTEEELNAYIQGLNDGNGWDNPGWQSVEQAEDEQHLHKFHDQFFKSDIELGKYVDGETYNFFIEENAGARNDDEKGFVLIIFRGEESDGTEEYTYYSLDNGRQKAEQDLATATEYFNINFEAV